MKKKQAKLREIISKLKSMGNADAVSGMARYGINPENNYGVSIHSLREIAKGIGKGHELARELWASGIHDARLLGSIVDDPEDATEAQMEEWSKGFNSWDICDQCCNNLFSKTRFAHRKAAEWSTRGEEFIKRAGFVLMANLAIHDRSADDGTFAGFLWTIEAEATDERNYVKKAINWALRQIGKRSLKLNESAIETTNRILKLNSKSARWIALDALRELTSNATARRIVLRQKRFSKTSN